MTATGDAVFDVRTRDGLLVGPHGPVPVRMYAPSVDTRVGLVWAHGGAFVTGDLDIPESDQVGRVLAEAGIIVVAVDYHLGPVDAWWADHLGVERHGGVHFPVPQEDVLLAFHRARVDFPSVIWSMGGASAGASIVASALLLSAGSSTSASLSLAPRPSSLVLAYPTLHARLPAPSRELEMTMSGVSWRDRFTPDMVATMNANHVGMPLASAPENAFAGGGDLTAFPPTYILLSEIDDLRASGEAFAAELRGRVPIKTVLEPGTRHGHLNDEGSVAALTSLEAIAAWLLSA